ncbi:MAG: murein L,D-transpeptidase [Candidatus Eremiobacteraeota bacterium]|nr:murein L,D-transpeptidase [Candidatus Eremiobacteraeota bacterium]MCW5869420.1 murein L,D-transpeptidase [Candidatus Eremiobacteraeota bacterium]
MAGGLGLGLVALAWPAHVQKGPAQLVCRPGQEIRLGLSGVPWWVKARIDGREVPVARDWHGFRLAVPEDQADGSIPLVVELGGLRGQGWNCQLQVDSIPPKLSIESPGEGAALAADSVTIRGSADGPFRMNLALGAGWNEIHFVARDAAGNESRLKRRLFSDRQSPSLSLERLLPDGSSEPLRAKDSPKDSFRVRVLMQDDSGIAALRYRLDGGKWQKPALSFQSQSWQALFPLRNLPEGSRKLEFEVVDQAGRRVSEEADFLVDSSEELGNKMLTPGARGQDIVQLQRRLVDAGVLKDEQITGEFDAPTESAVKEFQKREGLPSTGRVAQLTLAALGPRIFVNLNRFELVLDRPGEEPVRFPVACGQPAYPTPTGSFTVAEKVKDPSWIPPDSPWAREAETIPPGPSNPLGTRWIGLSWGSVGIHGTNADWSIGSASSHGCLRMHIYDVEALYDMLKEGTPVTIYGGWEDSPHLKRYWP